MPQSLNDRIGFFELRNTLQPTQVYNRRDSSMPNSADFELLIKKIVGGSEKTYDVEKILNVMLLLILNL